MGKPRFHSLVSICLLVFATGITHAAQPKRSAKKPAQKPVAPRSIGQAEKLRGQVTLIRAGQSQKIASDTPLQKGDLLRTSQDGWIRIAMSGSKIDLAPMSAAKVESVGKVQILYGHILVGVGPGSQISFHVPTASIRSAASIEDSGGAEFVAHVVRSEKEFHERLAGRMTEQPNEKELTKIASSPELFTQIGCLSGEFHVKPAGSDAISLKAADITQIHGKSADFVPKRVHAQELQSTIQSLGFSPY